MFRDHRGGLDEEDGQELQVKRRRWKQREERQEKKKGKLLVKPERADEQRDGKASLRSDKLEQTSGGAWESAAAIKL